MQPPKSLPNFRDLGGLPCEDGREIREGKLYRTPKLRTQYLKRDDKKATEEFLDALQLDTVLDFRSVPEVREQPDYVPKGATYYNAPFFDVGEVDRIIVTRRSVWRMLCLRGGRIPLLVEDKHESYRIMPYSNGQIALKTLFEALDRGDTIAFHCTEGKDRTGFAAYVLEHCLGRSDEAAREEYLASNDTMDDATDYQAKVLGRMHFPQELIDALNYVEHCHDELLDLALDAILARYDSLDDYLLQVYGVTEERRQKWRDTYTK